MKGGEAMRFPEYITLYRFSRPNETIQIVNGLVPVIEWLKSEVDRIKANPKREAYIIKDRYGRYSIKVNCIAIGNWHKVNGEWRERR